MNPEFNTPSLRNQVYTFRLVLSCLEQLSSCIVALRRYVVVNLLHAALMLQKTIKGCFPPAPHALYSRYIALHSAIAARS